MASSEPGFGADLKLLPDKNRAPPLSSSSQDFPLFADGLVVTLVLTAEAHDLMKQLRSRRDPVVPDLPPTFDRRNRERIALKIPLRVLSYGPLTEKSCNAVCVDLSEGGVAFETGDELTVGDIVILEFRLKGEEAYRCHARLTYRMASRYGGYFLGGQ